MLLLSVPYVVSGYLFKDVWLNGLWTVVIRGFYGDLSSISSWGIPPRFKIRKFTWGIMVSLDLRVWRPSLDMSKPSINMDPPAASIILNRLRVSDDFPAPVRPTTPTFSLPVMENVIPLRTQSNPSLYLTLKFLNSTSPLSGQVLLMLLSSISQAAS